MPGPFPNTYLCSNCGGAFYDFEKSAYIADIEIHRDKCIQCVNEIRKKVANGLQTGL